MTLNQEKTIIKSLNSFKDQLPNALEAKMDLSNDDMLLLSDKFDTFRVKIIFYGFKNNGVPHFLYQIYIINGNEVSPQNFRDFKSLLNYLIYQSSLAPIFRESKFNKINI